MLIEHKLRIAQAITRAVGPLAAQAGGPVPEIELDRPRQAAHGDLACNVALQLARPLRRNPREVAQAIVDALAEDPDAVALLDGAEVAGPGFINLRLTDAARREVVSRVLTAGERFGHDARGGGQHVMVEFVSANPTGPLHVGHGRQGALGDVLANLLAANGWKVQREFYYNDAGAQIANLARSVQARARGIAPDDPRFPEDGYRGDYIAEIASAYLARETVSGDRVDSVTGAGDPEDIEAIRRFAVAWLRNEQDIDLSHFGVVFDVYYLESSLYGDGKVNAVVDALLARDVTYEQDGALWLRTTAYGDDKDRVMRKSEGGYTYFVPDVAYHVTKWRRGFDKVINVQGADHHGTVARVRAGLQALDIGIPLGYPDYVLHKMVTVMRGGEEVKISKRAGSYVTLRDLIEWTGGEDPAMDTAERIRRGRDAVRFFLVSRKADTEFVFDVDLALAQTDENPVYYVQYAHARICSVFAQWRERSGRNGRRPGIGDDLDEVGGGDGGCGAGGGSEASRPAGDPRPWFDDALDDGDLAGLASVDLAPLVTPREVALMARMAEFPALLRQACDDLAPHAIAFYLKDLAGELHSYYNAERVLVDDPSVRLARLALIGAARQVLRNGLALLGVSAPERM